MIDPARTALFVPAHLKKFKLDLFNRIGSKIEAAGGRVVRGSIDQLARLPAEVVPIVGCTPELRPLIDQWQEDGRDWIYWDRGYYLRVFATWLPRGANGGMYRWHVRSFQMTVIHDVPADRLDSRPPPLQPWRAGGRHIVLAEPTPTYQKFHRIDGWTERTKQQLEALTDRPIIARQKESKRPLQADLEGAHCLIAHGSNAATEAVILGTPVIVDSTSAAALVGLTDIREVERPVYPEREPWLRALAYSQFDETELVDGTLWRLIR